MHRRGEQFLKFHVKPAESLSRTFGEEIERVMKDVKEQRLKVHELWLPALGGLVLLALAFLPFAHLSGDSRTVEIRTKAEVLAYQVAQLYRESLAPKGVSNDRRGPASVESVSEGFMGLDPWGNAYRYRISPLDGDRLRIEMRSAGPNGKFEDASETDDVNLIITL